MNLSSIEQVTKGRVKTSGVSNFSELPIEKVYPNPNQPRKEFYNIEELAETIKKFGLLQPIIVVKRNGQYMIVGGERRYRAHLLLETKTIQAFIVDLTDEEVQEVTLIENIQRDDLTDFEKAKHIGMLWATSKYKSKQELAKAIGKNSSYISKAFSCLKLPANIIEDIEENKNNIPISVLDEISRVKDEDIQVEAYEKYAAGEITRDEIKELKPGEKSGEISHGKKKFKEQFDFSPGKWSEKAFAWLQDPWEDIHEKLDEKKTYKITIEEV